MNNEKEKRKRIRLTSEKTLYLQRYFEVKPRPSTSEKREIAKCLGMSFRSVQVWFQNRRAKHKKDMQDMGSSIMYNDVDMLRQYATNNSLFMPRDIRRYDDSYYKEIDFYDMEKPKRMYKFHDCSGNVMGKREEYWEDGRDFWYDPYVQNYDEEEEKRMRERH